MTILLGRRLAFIRGFLPLAEPPPKPSILRVLRDDLTNEILTDQEEQIIVVGADLASPTANVSVSAVNWVWGLTNPTRWVIQSLVGADWITLDNVIGSERSVEIFDAGLTVRVVGTTSDLVTQQTAHSNPVVTIL